MVGVSEVVGGVGNGGDPRGVSLDGKPGRGAGLPIADDLHLGRYISRGGGDLECDLVRRDVVQRHWQAVYQDARSCQRCGERSADGVSWRLRCELPASDYCYVSRGEDWSE